MTHELRLNKSANSDEKVKELVAAHVALHRLEDETMQNDGTDDEHIFRWFKEPFKGCGCAVVGHDEPATE
jgi:hypothetical protein